MAGKKRVQFVKGVKTHSSHKVLHKQHGGMSAAMAARIVPSDQLPAQGGGGGAGAGMSLPTMLLLAGVFVFVVWFVIYMMTSSSSSAAAAVSPASSLGSSLTSMGFYEFGGGGGGVSAPTVAATPLYHPPPTIAVMNSPSFIQTGILTPVQGDGDVLPLQSRQLNNSRSKFQYYTISNQHNNIKLPVLVKGRNGMTEYGVDELYDGDTVYVEGIQTVYRVTLYKQ